MRYPNLRYGNPTEFQHYALGLTLPQLSRILRRDERTIRDWLSGKQRVPWWVPEYMRLRHVEKTHEARQMGFAYHPQIGVVRADVIALAPYQPTKRPDVKKPQETSLRLDDFDRKQATG